MLKQAGNVGGWTLWSASPRAHDFTVEGLLRLVPVIASGGRLAGRALTSDASGSALAVGGGDREVDVLLGVHADHELGHVHQLLAHAVFKTKEDIKK